MGFPHFCDACWVEESDGFSGYIGSYRGFRIRLGCGVREPPNRQRTALFNQIIDSLNHAIPRKTLPRVGLKFAGSDR